MVAVSQVPAADQDHGSGAWEAVEDVQWELCGILRAAAARTRPRATGGSVVEEEIRVFLGHLAGIAPLGSCTLPDVLPPSQALTCVFTQAYLHHHTFPGAKEEA